MQNNVRILERLASKSTVVRNYAHQFALVRIPVIIRVQDYEDARVIIDLEIPSPHCYLRVMVDVADAFTKALGCFSIAVNRTRKILTKNKPRNRLAEFRKNTN